MKILWPELKIVHGKPKHSQTQGSVARANQAIENMVTNWMRDNNSTNWRTGLKFVQFMKNRAHHSGIRKTSYATMFGVEPRVGLASTNLPKEAFSNVYDKDDLLRIFRDVGQVNTPDNQYSNKTHQNKELVNTEISNINIENNAVVNNNIVHNDFINNSIVLSETVDISVNNDLNTSPNTNTIVCFECKKKCDTDIFYCNYCFEPLHEECKTLFKNDVFCALCFKSYSIFNERKSAFNCLTDQTDKMKKCSDEKSRKITIGQTVRVPVPNIDHRKTDS